MSSDLYPTIKGLTWTVTKTPEFNSILKQSAAKTSVAIAQTQNPIWTWQLMYEYIYDSFLSQQNTMPYSPQTDLRTLMGFFLAHKGQFDDFLFDDPSDDWVGPMTWKPHYDYGHNSVIIDAAGHKQLSTYGGLSGAVVPTFSDSGGVSSDGMWRDQGAFNGSQAQELLFVTDGTYYYSPLQRNMGGLFSEDISDLNTALNPLRLWMNGGAFSLPAFTVNGPGLAFAGFSSMGLYVQWAAWQASTTYYSGALIVDPAGHLQKVTTPGTSGSSIPTFNDSGGTTPGDGGVTWTDQGAILNVTAAFNFFFRVRFLSDDQDFEQFMQQLWTVGGSGGKNGKGTLELTSSRSFP